MSDCAVMPSREDERLLMKRRALRDQYERRAGANALVQRESSGDGFAGVAERALRLASRALAARERLAPGGRNIQRFRDVSYGDDPRQTLDIYIRRGAKRAPVAIFFYGGAWRAGDKTDFEFIGIALARLGFAVVIGDQRLVPAVRFPSFLEDSAGIVDWTERHIAPFGGDPSRLLLIGHSAGAYNAVMLGLNPSYLARHNLRPQAVKGIVGLSGPYDFFPFPLDLCEDAFGSAPDPMQTQPVHFARADAPPLLIVAGGGDRHVPSENSLSLYEAQRTAGGACSLRWYEKASHLDTLIGLTRLVDTRAPVLNDLLEFVAAVGATAPEQDGRPHFGEVRLPLPVRVASVSG